ncbi:MAG TPA: GxxExxY protein [Candidatus Angelobacter sp.]|nr:GxxExxY protein [Candidatus Angelobacter sp.]
MHSPQMSADERRYKHSELTEKIIGVFYDVYNELGFGFLESVYESAMALALTEQGLSFERPVSIPVYFHNQKIGAYDADLLVGGLVLLELKACKAIEPAHEAQLLHYLRSTTVEVGLLLNFGPRPQVRRLAFENERKQISVHLRKSAAEGYL